MRGTGTATGGAARGRAEDLAAVTMPVRATEPLQGGVWLFAMGKRQA